MYGYVLPFLVTFLIIYGVMEKVEPFGGGQSRLHALFASLVGLFLLAFAPGGVIGAFFSNFFGAVAVVMVGLVLVMVVYALVFGQPTADSAFVKGLGVIGATAAAVLFLIWGGFSLVFPEDVSLYGGLGGYLDVVVVLGLLALLGWALFGGGNAGE